MAADNKKHSHSIEQHNPLDGYRSWIFGSSLMINLLAMAMPIMMLQIYDRIIPHRSMPTLVVLSLGVLSGVAAEAALRVVRSHLIAWLAARYEHEATLGVLSRLLASPIHEYERTTAGTYLEKLKSIGYLRDYYSGATFLSMVDLPFALIYLTFIFFASPTLVMVPLVGMVVYGIVSSWMARAQRDALVERNVSDRRRNSFLIETLTGLHSVKSMAMEALMLRRYERLQETTAKQIERQIYLTDFNGVVASSFGPVMTMGVVAVGAFLVIDGEMTNGELAACTMLALRTLSPLQKIGAIYGKYLQAQALKEDINDLFRSQPLSANSDARVELEGRIELKNVTYTFPNAKNSLLSDVNFYAEPGECVLIKGGNSSGRTTLMGIAQGLVSPTAGQVLIDDRDINEYDSVAIRRAVAYLPQRAAIFEGTLIENLTAFDLSRSDYAKKIAKDLGLDDFIAQLRRGFETTIGDAVADTMPVGHRQRIAMVRALSSAPKIVLFDETNNAVDIRGETAMLEYLRSIKGKVTLILITQRPSFHKIADRAYCLRDGTLVPDDGESDHQGRPKVVELRPQDQAVSVAFNEKLFFRDTDNRLDDDHRMKQLMITSFRRPTDFGNCLPPLLKALEWRGHPRIVAEALPYFEDELDLTGFMNTMGQLGYRSGEVTLRLDRVHSKLMPCLYIPEDRSRAAMLLLGHEGDKLRIIDGADGEERLITPRKTPGKTVVFRPLNVDEQEPGGKWTENTMARFRPLLGLLLAGAVVQGLLMLPLPLFVRSVYDKVIPSASTESLAFLGAGTLLAVGLSVLFGRNKAQLMSYLAGRIDYLFGTSTLKHILSLPPTVSEKASVGAQVARISGFETVRDLFMGPIAATLIDSPALLIFIVALGVVNPLALILLFFLVGIYTLLFFAYAPLIESFGGELSRHTTQRNEFLIEVLTKMRSVREFGGELRWLNRFRDISSETVMAAFETAKLTGTFNGLSHVLISIGTLMILVVTVYSSFDGTTSMGTVLLSLMMMWRLTGPLQTIFTNATKIERIRAVGGQINALMNIRGEKVNTQTTLASRNIKGSVGFNRVSFRYSSVSDPAVVGASFEVQPGEIVAITGPNGSGKSTILKLVAGIYSPQAGSVRVDGVDIRQLDPVELRRLVGYVPQECHLFFGTIAQNLRLVQPAATDEELMWALERTGALHEVQEMGRGIESRVGDGATEWVPESLKQKISLARAYLTKAPILLFDEPANGLDFAGDQLFMETVKHLRGRKTILFVTHRPSHIKLADRMLVFEGGSIRQDGPPEEVLKRLTKAN